MDVERLIECVKKHVYLYDIAHREYKNLALKNLVWEAIAAELNQTSEAVRHKWKTVKDGYIKYKKQLKKASRSGRKVIDYVWSPQLKFLDYHHTTRSSTAYVISQSALRSIPNAESLSSTSDQILSSLLAMPSTLPMTSSMQMPSSIPVPTENGILTEPDLNPAPTPPKRRKIENDYLNIINKYQNNNHDAIDYLFLSYAQTFKKFSDKQQVLLKMKLAELFSNAELEQLCNSNLESATEFAYVQPEVVTEYASSPVCSSASSTGSNLDQQTIPEENEDVKSIKQENDEIPLPNNF